ncbi:MAG: DNA-binding response regulator [Gammaproteobacteria bacterium HGW-Gammaproteobacteria-8]|nr:MAG: DNA-binding response regulator [Gammaproteobacteria bacterium HGW-Gammaproteobacteria-8]
MRILLVEDDELIGSGVRTALTRHGFEADWCRDGPSALAALTTGQFDLIVLDLGLPRLNGLEVLRRARHAGHQVPVLILTARDAIDDRVQGLDAGADDYLVKPFALDEFLARVRALIRRAEGRATNEIRIGALRILPEKYQAELDGRDLLLPRREFQLLLHLASRHPGAATKPALEQAIYGWDESGSSNAIEVHIHQLRRKLGPEWIETLRGVGYRLVGH